MRIECTLINDDGRHVLRHRDGVDNCSDCPWRHGFKDTSSGSISSINMGGKYLFLIICLYVRVEAPFHVIVPKNNYVTHASLGQTKECPPKVFNKGKTLFAIWANAQM